MKKKLLAVILTLCLAMGAMTVMAMAASVSRTELTSTGGELSSGSYYLGADITLSTSITINPGTTVTIDLNGYTLTGTGTDTVIKVYGTLMLIDNSSAQTGKITGGGSSYYGGGVHVWNGSFTMSGGTITNNSGTYGGGVYVANKASFTMNGGTITNNSGTYGGGVYVATSGSFTMSGGAITNNSGTYGGGIYVNDTFTVSGSPVISNNTGGNVYLNSGKYITLGGQLTNGASISVTTYSAPTSSSAVQITAETNTSYYSSAISYIFSDNSSYIVQVNSAGYLELALPTYTIRWLDEDGTELEKDTNVAYGTTPSYDGETPTKAAGLQYHYTFDDWTPTVTDVMGNATYTATYTQTAHTVEIQNAKEATCTEDGYTGDIVCTVCGMTISAGTVIPATGHSYEATVTAPTCTEKGYTTYTCSVCGDTYTADETTALGHNYEAVVTAPTCTEKGYTTYTCSVCGDTYTADETAALGHSYEAVVTAPTCTETGYTTYTCSVCGDTYTADETAALGHSYEFQYFTWSGDLKTATATFKCKTCGDTQTVDATISGVGSLGVSVHTASVTFDGETYSDSVSTGTSLLKTAADYTAVNSAIAKANSLNASDYSNFELVTAAIDAVNWNLSIINQDTVNAYAEAIETAIANLIPLVEETVEINEPVEDSTTETEPEEAEVTESEPETNPTTGVAVALLPMAMAIAGAIIGKQKL